MKQFWTAFGMSMKARTMWRMSPRSPRNAVIATLFWWLFGVSVTSWIDFSRSWIGGLSGQRLHAQEPRSNTRLLHISRCSLSCIRIATSKTLSLGPLSLNHSSSKNLQELDFRTAPPPKKNSMASSSQPTTSSSFELYENEFNTIIGRCNHSLARLVANNYTSDSTGSPPSKVIGDAEQSMQELAALMKSMQLEATSYSSRSSVRTTMDDKLAKLKLSMAQLRSDLRSVKDEQSSRELFGASGSGESSSLSLEQRSKMLKQTEQLEKTSERIKESKRIAAETEALGAQVLDDLSSQGQVLDRARGNLGNVNQDITRSFGIVGTMNRREWINKIAIYLVIGGFAAACFGLIIYRFSKK